MRRGFVLFARIEVFCSAVIVKQPSSDNTPYEKIGDEVRSLAVPFDIPDGWVWVHPTDIGFFGSGKTPAPDQLSKFGTIPYFKVADMNATGNEVYLCNSNSFLKLPNSMKLFSKGAVVYPKNGGAVFTNKKRILGQDSLVDLNTGSYTPFSQMDEKFFYTSLENICSVMGQTPTWASGLLLRADGYVCDFYKKD